MATHGSRQIVTCTPRAGSHVPHPAQAASLGVFRERQALCAATLSSAPSRAWDDPGPAEIKLYPPQLLRDVIPRPRLIEQLTAGTAKLVLVEAPAGFGKSTLVAQWRVQVSGRQPFAWVSLDQDDNDPRRFWRDIMAGLQRTWPGLAGADPMRWLGADHLDITRSVLPHLVNTLAESRPPIVLVLDNYHVIKEDRCHKQVEFLLSNLRPPAQVVMITRTAPPLPLARLRAAGEMTEIRAGRLRFTPGEIVAAVESAAAVRLAGRDLADLAERTEGWPAGVFLAALSLRGHRHPGTVIGQFRGTNHHVADYLDEEVLGGQPRHIQQFLTRTAFLSRFTAPLCDAVTGTSRAAEIIDVLERENLFLIALDDNREWFRYHRLFAELLQHRLQLTEPDLVPVLHRRASAWYQQHGPAEDGINHAIATGDAAATIDFIARHWVALASAGRLGSVRRWLRALDCEQIGTSPLAAHCAAWVAALSGEPGTVGRLLPVIESSRLAGRLPDGMRSMEFSAALLRGVFGFDGLAVMRDSAARALRLEPDPRSPWHSLALAATGFSRYLSGEPGAADLLERALEGETAHPPVRLAALFAATVVAVQDGRLTQAEAYAGAARHIVDGCRFSECPQSSLASTASGLVQAKQGRLEEARRELEQALRSRVRWPGLSPWPTLEAELGLAEVLLNMDDRTGCAAVLAEAQGVLTALPGGGQAQSARLERLQRRLAYLSGDTATPAGMLTERELGVLRLLQGGLSAGKIAQEIERSPNTVKTHIKASYRKLGASSRHEAVTRARELGLL